MSKEWYDKYKIESETPEFIEWFVEWYGEPSEFSDEEYEQDEYWVRRGFALAGWNAKNSLND